ncbi:DNA topoisomerase IB [Flocculibacter collagenilyticus]|uniref:DNA topoisomerase IB n=1 Tax=Flocculibacter collagenilyticus TaxID=2744479 RepID=UPI0018F41B03|nr:DNA topoisomerase IB [Flocculibacter collagenilyticus]
MARADAIEELIIARHKWGRGFRYNYPDGEWITCKQVLKRIKNLTIPPSWQKVRINDKPDAKLQALGHDSRERRQYIYHPHWQQRQQQKKFAKLTEFGVHLPAMRSYCVSLLEQNSWSKEKVLALMVLVLDQTGIRIGNAKYTQENDTYGLSTLRRKHIQLVKDDLQFSFVGKSNKPRQVNISCPTLVDAIKQSADQPGYDVFRYQNEKRQWVDVDNYDVNAFIQSYMHPEFSCKDFRMWTACRLAIELYPEAKHIKQQQPRSSIFNILVKLVAAELGNTVKICRDYYLHPKLTKAIKANQLPIVNNLPCDHELNEALTESECILMDVLN